MTSPLALTLEKIAEMERGALAVLERNPGNASVKKRLALYAMARQAVGMRAMFDAGVKQGRDEAHSYEWGTRPDRSADEAFEEARAALAQEPDHAE